jgi:hypothetical protein
VNREKARQKIIILWSTEIYKRKSCSIPINKNATDKINCWQFPFLPWTVMMMKTSIGYSKCRISPFYLSTLRLFNFLIFFFIFYFNVVTATCCSSHMKFKFQVQKNSTVRAAKDKSKRKLKTRREMRKKRHRIAE